MIKYLVINLVIIYNARLQCELVKYTAYVLFRLICILFESHGYGASCDSKSIHINLNKTYAVYLTSSHCNLALYMITRLITRYFIIHIVVYKVTW